MVSLTAESAARARPADKDPARAAILAQSTSRCASRERELRISRSLSCSRLTHALLVEADKRERAAKGPVTQGSVAVPKGALGPRGVGGSALGSQAGKAAAAAWDPRREMRS